ncbi:Hypothetical protein R9X50_00480300 [Acrodontium crateriforme]|uniref:Uncharacterized protein n=1 Tax=Acrodontium crateriforme TaxID=150365 RepID=A0AAQ3R8N3_9PEZI|nr:Hypothetical protein R9X50_00480300 [Acrodontium crateriforme]
MQFTLLSTVAFALAARAQSSTATSTTSGTVSATLWGGISAMTGVSGIDDIEIDYQVNVVNVGNCKTTFDLVGSAPMLGLDGTQTITLVQGASDYSVNYGYSTEGGVISLTETCVFSGTTQASCSSSLTLSLKDVTSTAISGATTVTNPSSLVAPVASGGDKLTSATGACTSTKNNAAAAATGVADVYKVVVVPAAAAMAAVLM